MEIILAEHAGFCFGVKSAMQKVEELINQKEKAYTLGPLIHNPQVVNKLERSGIIPGSLEQINEGNLIIRTHGVSPSLLEQAKAKGLNIIDATCPFVKKVHKLARGLSEKDYLVIIIGDPHHPEVQGIKSWCVGDVRVVEDEIDAKNIFTSKKVGVVVQTTQTKENVEKIKDILKQKLDIEFFYDTRCNATQERQNAAISLAKKVDIMLVVGGYNSFNTQRLVEVCQKVGANVYHIETAQQIQKHWFNGADKVGITAGASTPDWIIKEVLLKMDEINKELNDQELEKMEEGEMYEDTITDFAEDTIVDGTVVKVNPSEVFVDIGYKSEGIIPLDELSYNTFDSPDEIVKVGDEIRVYILKLEDKEGNLILSKKRADSIEIWDSLTNAFENNESIKGTVKEVVKGGMLADIKGLRGFIPASHVDIKYVTDFSSYVGKELEFKILEIDKDKNRLVLSHKQVLEEERKKLEEKTWASIEEGQTIKGIVRRLTDFGAFVDIGGVDGLIHISDISWQKIDHPSDVLSEDQEVEVQILKIDRERGRISLGLKQAMPDPWDTVEDKYKVDSIVEGKVVKIVSFGAFVEVEPGIEGLVHISQISKEHIPTVADVLNVGDVVKVKIIDIDAKAKRMSLSIKEAVADSSPKNNEKPYEMPKETGVTIGDVVGNLFKKTEDD